MVKNDERIFVQCLRSYCKTNGVDIRSYSHDWIFHLSKVGQNHVVLGYDLGVNSASSAQICADKSATFDVLDSHRISSVPHHLFLEPWKMQFVDNGGNWVEIVNFHRLYGGKTVIKQNDGTGGRNVYLTKGINALEAAVQEIFAKERSVSLSPYLDVEREVRFYIANGQPVLCYEKNRPQVIGDGANTVAALACQMKFDFSKLSSEDLDWNYIPPAGEAVPLTWKHNLGGGATMSRLLAEELPDALELALSAFHVLGLSAASVDVLFVGGSWMVLEINTGIMIENAYSVGAISQFEAQEIYNEFLDLLEF